MTWGLLHITGKGLANGGRTACAVTGTITADGPRPQECEFRRGNGVHGENTLEENRKMVRKCSE